MEGSKTASQQSLRNSIRFFVKTGRLPKMARPLNPLESLVASKFLGYETKPDGATER